MNCIKCDEIIPEHAKFCPYCGQNQEDTCQNRLEETALPPVGGYLMEEHPMDRKLEQILKNTARNRLFQVAMALIAVATVCILSLSDETRVSLAVGKTVSQLQSEREEMMEQLPLISFFSDISQTPVTLEFSSNSTFQQDFSLSLDWAKEQLEFSTSLVTQPFHLTMSSDYTTVSFAEEGPVYGLNHQTMGQDLNHCDFLSFDVDPAYQFQPFTVDVSAYEDLEEILFRWVTTLLQGMEVEKSNSMKKTLFIQGKERNVTTYLVEFTPESVKTTLEGMVQDVLYDPVLRGQLEQSYMVYSSRNILGNLMGTVKSFEEVMGNFEENLYGRIALFVADYEALPTRAFQIYLYKGKMMGLSDPYGENLISFSSAKDLLEGITLGSGESQATHSFQIQDQVFSYKGNSSFPVSHVEYNFASSDQNFHVRQKNNNSWITTVDSTEPNKLWVLHNGVYAFEKEHLEPDWFSQERDLPPLLNLSKKEAFVLFLGLF